MPPVPSPQALADTARTLADGAASILRGMFRAPRHVKHKGAIDLVTDADLASEAWLQSELQRLHPGHAILAEEGGARGPADAPVTWVMDPLDGTTNYAHGNPHFAVSVAAVSVEGAVLAGAVADVMRRETFTAWKDGGAWLHCADEAAARRMGVSTCTELGSALLATGFPYDRATVADNNHAEHDHFSVKTQGVRRPGAAALDLAWTAAGRVDGYWEATLKPWDVAAGALLVLEAGGVVTGWDGSAFRVEQHHAVTAGPALHPVILRELAAVRATRGLKPVPRT